jgi:chromate transporter
MPHGQTILDIFLVFLRLGLTSFGGPVAHLGYFRAEFVERRRWVDLGAYAEIVALCQFLPGPASSQVGIVLGLSRGGLLGGFAAWLGFTAPSALAMIAFAYGVGGAAQLASAGWLHGLKIVAVAVVAQAVWSMAQNLCPDRPRATLAICAAALALLWPSSIAQLVVIALGGAFGWRFLPAVPQAESAPLAAPVSRRVGLVALALFAVALLGLPALASVTTSPALAAAARFYDAGALVFGGGHVVLPLLQEATVATGMVDKDLFLAGYGAAQALPGPLFAFAAFLGAATPALQPAWFGGVLCLAAIYLPSFLLLLGVLPFWETLRRRAAVCAMLAGVNAAVVGLLFAALYTPVFTSAIFAPRDFALASVGFLLLVIWRAPPWLIALLGALAGQATAMLA